MGAVIDKAAPSISYLWQPWPARNKAIIIILGDIRRFTTLESAA